MQKREAALLLDDIPVEPSMTSTNATTMFNSSTN
jgi:hypothetical protein